MTGTGDDIPPGIDLAALRARLAGDRAALTGASAAAADARKPVELDQTSVGRLSRMDAIQQQAMAMATDQRRHATLLRIDAALARMDTGEYGWCIGCGDPIAPGRLSLDPSTPTCVDCAATQGAAGTRPAGA